MRLSIWDYILRYHQRILTQTSITKIEFIILWNWNVIGAFLKPKNIILHSCKPLWVLNTILKPSSYLTLIVWRSSMPQQLINNWHRKGVLTRCCIQGPIIITKAPQVPSFSFLTNNTVEENELVLCCITPSAIIYHLPTFLFYLCLLTRWVPIRLDFDWGCIRQ